MFRPLPLFIGLRYTRSKRRFRFISFISFMSLFGIALGVMVLITVLSVMNGFDQQIREKIFTLVPHITITGMNNTLSDWRAIEREVKATPGVVAVTPVVVGQGLLIKDGVSHPAIINGVVPNSIKNVVQINQKVVEGSMQSLKPGTFDIVLGDRLAAILGVIPGDTVNLITPQANITPIGVMPRFRQFKVTGIFHAGAGFGFDAAYAYANLTDMQKLYSLGQKVTSLQIKVKDLFKAPQIASIIQQKIGENDIVSDWTAQFGAFYHAVQMEKTMMFLILLLIIAIAAFNLVSSLMMAVKDKESDIAILRTLGMTPRTIMAIFIVQGGIVGLIGTTFGLIAGVILSLNITALANILQRMLGVQLINANVYFVNFLPSQLQTMDLVHVCLIAFSMSLLATIYPAWRASKVQPAEALRYE